MLIKAWGSNLAVIRNDGLTFSLRWIGVISTAVDCSEAPFDWSASTIPTSIDVMLAFTGPVWLNYTFAATMSDCAVYHLTPKLNTTEPLPSWITFSKNVLTFLIDLATPLGPITIEQIAYMSDSATGYREDMRSHTITIYSATSTECGSISPEDVSP